MNTNQGTINSRKIAIFLIITFILAIVVGSIPALLKLEWQGSTAAVIGVIYMLFPALTAIFVQKVLYHEPVMEPLKVSFKLNKWFAVAWFLPVLLALAAIPVETLFPGVSYSPDMAGMVERYRDTLTAEQLAEIERSIQQMPVHPVLLAIVSGMIAGITVNALAAFGEELGWRGFLLREFKALGFARASLFIGIIWGLWHAPLILQGHNYPQHPVAGVFMMILFCLLLTPLLNYVTLKAQSVIAAAIMHGTLNGTVGIAIMMVKGGSDLTIGLTGAAGLITLLIANVVLYIATGGYRSIKYSED
jgi:membrane protease YdiL (CAAX protease family)